MKIAAFSKYMAFGIGGAEVSTYRLLEDRELNHGDSITVISQANARFIGNLSNSQELPHQWNSVFIDNLLNLKRFSYLEYIANRKVLMRWFDQFSSSELWSYGISAPAAILSFQGHTRYFVRSESDLGIIGNYYTGTKRIAKALYSSVEYSAIKKHRTDLTMAIERSTVIANSKYMASRTRELFNITPEIIYPPVDIDIHRKQLEADPVDGKWVVFVGDSPVKGLSHVLAAARQLPATSFRIYSRFVQQLRQEENITWMPWEKDAWRVYRGARLVIVPSQWEEAYGRVAREAYLLGIPVLVSNVGGLPEAVDEDQSCLVDDFRNPDAWVRAITNAVTMQQDLELSQ